MNIKVWMDSIKELGVDFYTGVPDSQLKALCDELYANYTLGKEHIVAANEGAAVGLAAGHYLATKRPALVYMQNSGIGNAINPIASLIDEHVYRIPMVFVIGWRGEPGVKDEPQHVFQGQITTELMEVMKIPYYILDQDTSIEDMTQMVKEAKELIQQEKSVSFIVRKGAFSREEKAQYCGLTGITREEALEIVVQAIGEKDAVVSTTGKLSRELFEIREKYHQGHAYDFLTVGSMGHASMIAMGIALEKPKQRVWCLDGDGASVMHMGSMDVAANTGCRNLVHIVFNNGAHETVGGMPVAYGRTDFTKIAEAMKYHNVLVCVRSKEQLIKALAQANSVAGPVFLEIQVSLGARTDLGRPTTTPIENKEAFMRHLSAE